jgi:hypothetical protein
VLEQRSDLVVLLELDLLFHRLGSMRTGPEKQPDGDRWDKSHNRTLDEPIGAGHHYWSHGDQTLNDQLDPHHQSGVKAPAEGSGKAPRVLPDMTFSRS